MKKLLPFILILLFSVQARATQYYIAPASGGGSDANNGTSVGTPWLSPNHAVNCGDILTAAAGTYSSSNFTFGSFHSVTGSGHCVAWLICTTFDACLISNTGGPAMWITNSHWGIMGFEASQTTSGADNYSCFFASPGGSAVITDIIWANDIANGCRGSGFHMGPNGSFGVDYVVTIADIAYNAAQESSQCASGIAYNYMQNSDTSTGTHDYVSQTFSWGNVNPSPCAGGTPTDGEGFIFDTPDTFTYTGQFVMQNNISTWNGASGFRTVTSTSGSHIYILNNTGYADSLSTLLNSGECAEFYAQQSYNVEFYRNIGQTTAATGCGSNPIYGLGQASGNTTDTAYNNFLKGVGGNNIYAAGCNAGQMACLNNTLGTDPGFVSPPGSTPAAPSCSGKASVIDCMSTTIAGFVPTAAGTSGLGYQRPSTGRVYDPLFPQWLCQYSSQLSGLVTMGCLTGTANAPGVVILQGVTIK